MIVADNNVDGAAHAYALAKRGYEVIFYSPNKYAVDKTLQYKHLASHYLTRMEFMKLITGNKLSATQQIDVEADVLIIPTNTLSNEAETINNTISLVRSIFVRKNKFNFIILAGINSIGSTAKLISKILDFCTEIDKEQIIYIGCPLHITDKIPVYSKAYGEEMHKIVSELYGIEYITTPSPEIAEYATLLKAVEKYVIFYLGVQLIFDLESLDLSSLDYVNRDELTLGFEDKQIEEAFSYLQRSEKVSSYTTKIINEVLRCRKKALTYTTRYARRMLKELTKQKSNPKVLAILNNDDEQSIITGLLPSRNLKLRVKHLDDIPLSDDCYSFLEGFDIVISNVACPEFSRVLKGLDNVYVFDLMRPVRNRVEMRHD